MRACAVNAGAGRFDLTVRLLDATSRQAAAQLCDSLAHALRQALPDNRPQGAAASPPPAAGTAELEQQPQQQSSAVDVADTLQQLQHVRGKLRIA